MLDCIKEQIVLQSCRLGIVKPLAGRCKNRWLDVAKSQVGVSQSRCGFFVSRYLVLVTL
jgi:hypothetical protein